MVLNNSDYWYIRILRLSREMLSHGETIISHFHGFASMVTVNNYTSVSLLKQHEANATFNPLNAELNPIC